jgi:hypothetical protein
LNFLSLVLPQSFPPEGGLDQTYVPCIPSPWSEIVGAVSFNWQSARQFLTLENNPVTVLWTRPNNVSLVPPPVDVDAMAVERPDSLCRCEPRKIGQHEHMPVRQRLDSEAAECSYRLLF